MPTARSPAAGQLIDARTGGVRISRAVTRRTRQRRRTAKDGGRTADGEPAKGADPPTNPTLVSPTRPGPTTGATGKTGPP
ncbi:MAG TPA: hypothetical protein VEG38_01505, partial [Acidimicrobiia bacterium]|nr:hypothetical protein [Acidimicrobiia bacterium]